MRLFAEAIRAQLIDKTTESWMFWFGLLLKYKEREGHCVVPNDHMENGSALGSWVDKKRQMKRQGRLSERRVTKLNALGFVWTPRGDR